MIHLHLKNLRIPTLTPLSKRFLKPLKWVLLGFLIPLLSLFLPSSSWSFNSISTQVSASDSTLETGQIFLLGITIFSFASLVVFALILYVKTPPEKRELWWGKIVPKSLTKEQRVRLSNRFFFLLVFGGLYLSLAAIAAIPSLQETKSMPDEFNPNTLKVHINESMTLFNSHFPTAGSDNLTVNPFIQVAKDNPFTTLESLVEASETNPTGNSSQIQINAQNLEAIKDYLNEERNKRIQLIDDGNKLLLITRQTIQKMSMDSITEYRSNVVKTGKRETINHFFEILQWFEKNVNDLELQLNTCLSGIQTTNDKWKMNAEKLRPYLTSSMSVQELLPQKSLPDLSLEKIENQCKDNILDKIGSTPKRDDLGEKFGFLFNFLFGWLLKSESLPLAMIVGLLGFGLLGSACSSFVRERIDKTVKKKSKEDSPLVEDLPKVFVIGVSAAILAFLSVMGGFSVLFTNATEPNPYSLLLVCLVAAAFGEDVWSSAQEKLRSKLKQDKQNSALLTSPIAEMQPLIAGQDTHPTQILPSVSAEQSQLLPGDESK